MAGAPDMVPTETSQEQDIYSSCVRFRRQMETGLVDLDEAMQFLVKMSSLLLARVRSLLPARALPEPDNEVDEEIQSSAASATRDFGPPDGEAVGRAFAILEEMIERASRVHARGISFEAGLREEQASDQATSSRETSREDYPDIEIAAEELARIWASVKSRAGARTRTITVPRLSFVVHLRRIWRAVLAAAKDGLRIRFSDLSAGHPKWMKVMDFLALLELVRRGRILVWQEEALGEIEFTVRTGVSAQGVEGKLAR